MPLTQPKTDLAYLRNEKAKAEQMRYVHCTCQRIYAENRLKK